MKAMPALFSPDATPRAGQGPRKVADGESGRQGTDFTRELRKQENPDRQARASGGPVQDGTASRIAEKDMKMEGASSFRNPELSAELTGAGDLSESGNARHERRGIRQGDAPADALPHMDLDMPEEVIAAAGHAGISPQVALPVAGAHGGKAEKNGMRTTASVIAVDGLLPEADAPAGDVTDSPLPEGLHAERAEVPVGRERLRLVRKMVRLEPAGDEARTPVKVVSVSAERHLEPAGTLVPGGREGMWRGAAAQVLAALDEGLMPHALAGLDGVRTGGPKVMRNLEIQLHPASLGTVTARLAIVGGNMEITISVPDRRLADQMERGLDQLVRRIRARDHGSGHTVVHLVTEPQSQNVDRLQQQMPGYAAADGRPAFGGQTREGTPGGGHGGKEGHGSAHAHDEGGAGHDGMGDADGIGRTARHGGLLYL